jgi:hypothetical protein
VNEKGSNARWVSFRIELWVGLGSMPITTIKRPALTPPAAAHNLPSILNEKISAVANELSVNAENRP